MIWESWPWKRELARRADALARRKEQRRWTDASGARVEQDVFTAGFAMRKLLEAKKLSDEVEGVTIHARRYARRGRRADLMNWHKIGDRFDLGGGIAVTLALPQLCNQIIHSFVFVLRCADDGGLDGFFVASDHERSRGLLAVDIDEFIAVLRRVAADDVVVAEWHRDPKTGDIQCDRRSNGHGAV